MAIDFFKTFYSSYKGTWSQKRFTVSKETYEKISSVAQKILICFGYGLTGGATAAAFLYYPIDATAITATAGLVYVILKDECDALFEKIWPKPKDPKQDPAIQPPSLWDNLSTWLSPKPAFIAGQPPTLTNPHMTSCFMNATFQCVWNDPCLKKNLSDSISLWNRRYKDLAILYAYLSNETRALVLQTDKEKLPSTTFIIPSVLTLFAHEDFAPIKNYLLKNLPYFKIPFENLVLKIQNKQPFNPQDIFYDDVTNQKILDFFLENNHLKSLILKTQPDMKKKQEAFFALSEILQKCQAAEENSEICLEPLRPLLLEGYRQGQQDALDFLNVLMHLIVESGISCSYFFKIVHEKHYEKKEMKGKEAFLASKKDPSAIDDTNTIKADENTFQLIIKPKKKSNQNGQELVNELFVLNPVVEEAEPCAFKSSDNVLDVYQLSKEKHVLSHLPDRFILSLARGVGTRKNTAAITIPQELTMQGHTYQMHSAVLHSGTSGWGHYKAFVKKEEIWWECDDLSYISKASSSTISRFLDQGSFYFFTRVN